jgi:hypothetical protein
LGRLIELYGIDFEDLRLAYGSRQKRRLKRSRRRSRQRRGI